MRKLVLFIFLLSCVAIMPFVAQTVNDVSFEENLFEDTYKPLYQISKNLPPLDESHFVQNILAGTESGLYKIIGTGTPVPLWTKGRVTQILHTQTEAGEQWFFVTSHGLLYSSDLETFSVLGDENGLPVLTLKKYDGKETSLEKRAKEIKDISVHPENPYIIVVATGDSVFLTKDGGKTWSNLGFSASTSGTKAVAVADMNVPNRFNEDGSPKKELTVFVSHAIYGLSYIFPDRPKKAWNDITGGFDALPTNTYPDELSDLVPIIRTNSKGFKYTELYISQTFLPNIFKLDWEKKRGVRIYHGEQPVDTIDGLFWTGTNLLYTRPGGLSLFNINSGENTGIPSEFSIWQQALAKVPEPVYSAYIPQNLSGFETPLILNELWLLKPEKVYTEYSSEKLNNIKSLYVPSGMGSKESGRKEILQILKENNLNSIVIDMKDDFGSLRYKTQDPLVSKKTYVSRYAVDIDKFVEFFKSEDIYLIARIVVFKDKHLFQYGNGKYAIWNYRTKSPWVGIKRSIDHEDENGNVISTDIEYYDEHWVDPYSHEVWEYNIAIAKELIAKGFDEIQFDYIRFPTDGRNLGQASYRWKDEGMNKESALISFLSYARENIDAPIGIDIYGANGWYRSGARTGQDVELLSEYVDVICPMFYPSHFEQGFLAQAPAAERPYRIYYYGTYRNSVIARNKSVIRPWAQAFYLPVSYDKRFYDKNYVQRQIFGVRDSVDRGYMYWNNVGRYEDICPDIDMNTIYPWSAFEADRKFKKPALTGIHSTIWAEEKQKENLQLENSSENSSDSLQDSENVVVEDNQVNTVTN